MDRRYRAHRGSRRLDKVQLKVAYKDQLRKPRAGDERSGAGLGLRNIARKASAPLSASLDRAGRRTSLLQPTRDHLN